MFDFSLGKLILLALIALIVLGPDKLPGAARTAGALLRRLRNGWDSVRAEVERELEVEEIRRAARQAAADAEAAQSEASEALRRLHDEVEKARAEVDAVVADRADPPAGAAAGKKTEGLIAGGTSSGERADGQG